MTHMMPPPLALNPQLDVARLATHFDRTGRLQIEDFLDSDSADILHRAVRARTDWRHVINGENRVFEIPRDQYDAMRDSDRAPVEQAMFAKAAYGFQFQFDTLRVPDGRAARRASGSLIDVFADFMGSPAVLGLLKSISGEDGIAFADCQVTRYLPGDFLTRHDDAVDGKHRRLAYVLSLTPQWLPEWGGLLLFNGPDGRVIETMTPRFNSLSLFTIGQPHSVSYVAPYAADDRLSLTGWLRAQSPPA